MSVESLGLSAPSTSMVAAGAYTDIEHHVLPVESSSDSNSTHSMSSLSNTGRRDGPNLAIRVPDHQPFVTATASASTDEHNGSHWADQHEDAPCSSPSVLADCQPLPRTHAVQIETALAQVDDHPEPIMDNSLEHLSSSAHSPSFLSVASGPMAHLAVQARHRRSAVRTCLSCELFV